MAQAIVERLKPPAVGLIELLGMPTGPASVFSWMTGTTPLSHVSQAFQRHNQNAMQQELREIRMTGDDSVRTLPGRVTHVAPIACACWHHRMRMLAPSHAHADRIARTRDGSVMHTGWRPHAHAKTGRRKSGLDLPSMRSPRHAHADRIEDACAHGTPYSASPAGGSLARA